MLTEGATNIDWSLAFGNSMDDFVPPLVLLHVLSLVLHSNWVPQILAAEHFIDETSQAHVPFHLLAWNWLLTIDHSVR